MLEVRNISKSYGKTRVLNNVSLKIEENAITSLIGANAAGKSTLFGIMSRLLSSDSGEVILDGKEISEYKSKDVARKLAILKQTQSANVKITVRDLVSFGRFPHSGGHNTKIDLDKIDEAIEYMLLKDIEDKYIDELSGGQRQRAYIAMIIAQDTKYILLDEPLNNLDIKYAVEMMNILKKLVKELGKTIVIVLHDINFATSYSDYVVAMKDGEIIATGDVSDVISKEILDNIYDFDFNIIDFEGQKVCVYYK